MTLIPAARTVEAKEPEGIAHDKYGTTAESGTEVGVPPYPQKFADVITCSGMPGVALVLIVVVPGAALDAVVAGAALDAPASNDAGFG